MKYTAYYDQINRTNYQVEAETEEEAEAKTDELYRKHFDLPSCDIQEGWISESDGADK